MRLKSIEIFGFKSFGKKVIINFSSPVTAIVGPNGSGKSNIVDAVRWVLGEQRVKSLRGNKMEDVIFSGSVSKKALGYAQVSIILDNSDGMFKIGYDEIEITRRLFRSGESEYLINKTKCRLMDIQNLLMDTGLSREGYSIIGQGQIESIVNNSPQERKLLIEEAVGIVKYKSRRIEAEKKLEKATANLYRITDLISELENRLPNLKKQAQKAETFRQLSNELRDIEVSIFVSRMDMLSESLKKAEGAKKEIEHTNNIISEDIAGAEEEKAKLAEDIRKLSEEILSVSEELKKAEDEYSVKNDILTSAKNEKALNEERIGIIASELEKIAGDIEELSVRKEDALRNIEVLQKEVSGLKAVYEEKFSQSEELRNKKASQETALKDIEEKIRQAEGSLSKLRENRITYIERIKSLEENIKFFESDKEQKQNYLSDLAGEKKDNIYEDGLNNAKEELEKVRSELSEVTKKGETVRDEISELFTSIQTKDSRLKLLKGYDESLQGYKYAVRKINELKNKDPYFGKGIRGILGEVVRYKPVHAQAISRALGGAVEYIITSDEQVASKAIYELKKNQWGRLTFLPKNIIRSSNVYIDPAVNTLEGFVGLAVDLIECDEEYRQAVDSVLYKTVVADTLDNANKIASRLNYKHKIVTLDGDVIMSGGAMVGGKSKNEDGGVLSRKAEIQALSEEISEDKAVYEELLRKRSVLSEEYKALRSKVAENEEALSEIKEKYAAFSLEQKNVLDRISQAEKEILSLDEKITSSSLTKDRSEEELKIISEKISQAEEHIKSLEDEKASSVTDDNEDIYAVMEEVSAAKMNYSSREQTLGFLIRGKDDLTDRITSLEDQKNEKNALISESREKVILAGEIIENEEENIRTLSERKNELNDSLSALTSRSDILKDDESKLQGKIISLLGDKTAVTEKLGAANTNINKIELQIENLSQNMLEDYEITYAMAREISEEGVSIAELGDHLQKVGELKEKIKRLGNINADAIEEYANERDRYEEMCIQRDDLINSKEELKGIIDDISENMLTQFKREFSVIQKEFNSVFRELFNGGEAKLILTDPDDILNSGVDIMASPPSTKLKNISALSGGEKTMTAISLIFAIIRIKPSPFIVLDEIDAALDDANVVRYCGFLRSIQKSNQFIIITHKKKTMENSDILYGATMNNDGITKIVSVRLSDINEKGELK